MRGLGATSLDPLITAAIQLGPVPILLHAWGAAKYGDWLIVSAVPSYLTFCNLGLGDASGSDMTVRVGAGDRQGALETFQSSLLLVATVASLVLMGLGAVVWRIPWHAWLHFSSLTDRQAAEVILSLATYVLVGQHGGIIESGFRCDGNFALGTFWANILRLTEAALASLVGLVSGNLLYMALSYLSCRGITLFAYALLLRHKSPWLEIGIRHATVKRIKELAAPAVGFIAIPLGYAISLQGFTIAIASALGPLVVTQFSTLRTLTRLNPQLVNPIFRTVWPEISTAYGAGHTELVRRLFRNAFKLGLVLAIFALSILWMSGPWLYQLWIRNTVHFERECFLLLLFAAFTDSLWFMSSVVPISTNRHSRIGLIFVSAAAVSVVVGRLIMPSIGVAAAAWGLLAVNTLMIWIGLNTSLRLLGESLATFVKGLFVLPSRQRLSVTTQEMVYTSPDADDR